MPITASSLIAPTGEIDAAFFPSDDAEQLAARVQGYLDDGYARAAALSTTALKDRAATAWAYYRANKMVYLRLSALPSSVDIPTGGSHSFTNQQIETFATNAKAYLDEFNLLIPSVPPIRNRSLPNPVSTRTIIE